MTYLPNCPCLVKALFVQVWYHYVTLLQYYHLPPSWSSCESNITCENTSILLRVTKIYNDLFRFGPIILPYHNRITYHWHKSWSSFESKTTKNLYMWKYISATQRNTPLLSSVPVGNGFLFLLGDSFTSLLP